VDVIYNSKGRYDDATKATGYPAKRNKPVDRELLGYLAGTWR
jgi:hypothetical protein